MLQWIKSVFTRPRPAGPPRTIEVAFYLKRGERPDLIKLNLALEGPGKVWIRKLELSYMPLQ